MTTLAQATYTGLTTRVGMAGFLFFFIKGLLWLLAPFVFVWFG